MHLKSRLKLNVALEVSQDVLGENRRAAWRFGFGIMQPKAVMNRPYLACNCPSPEHLLDDCEWHGVRARTICFAP